MSLDDLTRRAFQNGLTAQKWADLSKLLIEQRHSSDSLDAVGLTVCNSVLVLSQVHHGDPQLRDYLVAAIRNGILPLPVFVRTFLQAAQSQGPQQLYFWTSLCSVAVQVQRESDTATIGSIVSVDQPASATLSSIHDALNLVNILRFPLENIQDLGNLLLLLISCVNINQMAQVPTAQLAATLHLVTALLHSTRLPPYLHHALEGFEVDLRLAMDSNPGTSDQTTLLPMPPASNSQLDVTQPIPDTDIIICSSVLRLLVEQRGSYSSSANAAHAVHLFTALWKWTGWTLPVFYRQLLLSALTQLSEFSGSARQSRYQSHIWKAFVIGRLPLILKEMDDVQAGNEGRTALYNAVCAVLQHNDLMQRCNYAHLPGGQASSLSDLDQFTRPFLVQMVSHGLLDAHAWDPSLLTREWATVEKEARTIGVDLNEYISVKLSSEPNVDELTALVSSAVQDYSAHAPFYTVLLNRLSTFTETFDVESLSCFAKILMGNHLALEIMALHIRFDELIDRTATGPQFDLSAVGDPQTTVSQVGDIILFIQATILRFKIFAPAIRQRMRAFDPTAGDLPRRRADLSPDDSLVYQAWSATLFDKRSEGIEDSIFRSMRIVVLLRVAPALILEAIAAVRSGSMEKEVLDNGVSYFLGPLLSWTLVGVIKALLQELQETGFKSPVYLEILHMFMMSSTTPQPVLQICSPILLRILQEKQAKRIMAAGSTIDVVTLRQRALAVLGVHPNNLGKNEGQSQVSSNSVTTPPVPAPTAWTDLAQHAIRNALVTATTGRPTFLDVPRCLVASTPLHFLHNLWTELLRSAMMNGLPPSQRLAVFVLTVPRVRLSPDMTRGTTLLPIFLQSALPKIISSTDIQSSRDIPTELLVGIISSSLTASFYLVGDPMDDQTLDSTNAIGTLARGVAKGLQAQQSASVTSQTILQRLSAMPVFCTHFPTFAQT